MPFLVTELSVLQVKTVSTFQLVSAAIQLMQQVCTAAADASAR